MVMLGMSLRAVLSSCSVSLLGTNRISVVAFFFDTNSGAFHLCISVDPVNAAPTTSTRVFYISVGVCCAVIFLVAIILAVLHLHSMKRIELDDRYVFRVFKGFFGDVFMQALGTLGLRYKHSVETCSFC